MTPVFLKGTVNDAYKITGAVHVETSASQSIKSRCAKQDCTIVTMSARQTTPLIPERLRSEHLIITFAFARGANNQTSILEDHFVMIHAHEFFLACASLSTQTGVIRVSALRCCFPQPRAAGTGDK